MNIVTKETKSTLDSGLPKFKNEKIKQPRGYASLMYHMKGDGNHNRYMTLTDYATILKSNFPKATPEQIVTMMHHYMDSNIIYDDNGRLRDSTKWNEKPLIIKGYENLIQFR